MRGAAIYVSVSSSSRGLVLDFLGKVRPLGPYESCRHRRLLTSRRARTDDNASTIRESGNRICGGGLVEPVGGLVGS